MRHPLTTTLTCLLVAAQAKPEDFEYRVYQILERLIDIADWKDEKRADLYALLAESVLADDSMLVIEQKVIEALDKNARRFP